MESVYIGVVGGETIPYNAISSIYRIARRPIDTDPLYIAATKGFEARQSHINNFIASKHDYILLLDHDMVFPTDTLERLLSHKMPYVSGLYMRRTHSPILPIWFESEQPGEIPNRWFTRQIEDNKLYEIGASGWGVMLMHRSVVEKTRELLKGEPDIIEDDMDVYPYNLGRIMQAVNALGELADNPPARPIILPALKEYANILREEIRPNRVVRDHVGSDVRYPFYAKLAGFQLYGDSSVKCDHILNYPLSALDWTAQGPEYVAELQAKTNDMTDKERERIAKARAAL